MSKVPGRFLGYAFCVGDLLLELDLGFRILNADGAVRSTLGIKLGSEDPCNFLGLLTERGRGIIQASAKTLTGANRLGPFNIHVGEKGGAKEQYVVFMAKLPHAPNRYYFVLSKPYRLGTDSAKSMPTSGPESIEESKVDFFSRLEGLFEGNAEAEEKMQVTFVGAAEGEVLDGRQQREIEDYLNSFSLGGNHAAMLGDDRFAFVHEKDGDGPAKIDFAREIKKATGIQIDAATVDAAEAKLSDQDSMRAMVFSLQQFARKSEGYGASDIEEKCSTLIGENTARVAAFRDVLENGSFTLVYQPIVHLKKGSTHHFEALTRFDLPNMIKSQWEMIRFAEDVGLIPEFDTAVLQRTIQKLRELQRAGATPGIAVNVSGRSLSDPEFLLDLVSVLKGNKDLKSYLSIEITESAQIHDLDTLGDALKEIRAEGFRVYLDDFGAGAAGFQYLKKLKVDALKIDGDYVRDALTSKEDRAYLRSMVTLCQDLGIVTVGEWIETKEHAILLRDMGVDYGQGYYFGKPSAGLIVPRVKF